MRGSLSSGTPDRSPEPPSSGTAQPPAQAAFLRGVERRAAVLAELQCGDDATGDAAVAVAMRQFQADAGSLPMGQWPARFWQALLAQPGLRSHQGGSNGPEPIDALAGLDPGSRAALLLHLVAGLDETAAAAALGVAGPTYRRAVRRALPRGVDGHADLTSWRRLQQQIQQRLKGLPPPRLVRLGRNREAALAGAGQAALPHAGRPRSRLLLPLLWGALALCALGFGATFWMDAGGRGGGPQLPVEAPASRYSADAGRIAHRDFALLADPQGVAQASQLAFHSWLADQGQDGTTPVATAARTGVEPDPAVPVRLPVASAAVDPALLADFSNILPRLQPAQRARLQQQAAQWSGWSAAERRDFTTRTAQWDALSPSEQGAARERYRAWLALPPQARVRIDAAARRYRALPSEQQRELRASFDALDRSLQRGWLLGPGLGADYAKLQPLLAQVPAAEHAELLRVLRAMTVTQRDDLAVLVQRTPPQERARLRRELVSTAAGNRDDWLWNRLHR